MSNLTEKLEMYAKRYQEPPYGREVEGTADLLLEAAAAIREAELSVSKLRERFMDGMHAVYQGDDESDGIECPICGYEAARNDDYPEMKPKHCPACGTKLIY